MLRVGCFIVCEYMVEECGFNNLALCTVHTYILKLSCWPIASPEFKCMNILFDCQQQFY